MVTPINLNKARKAKAKTAKIEAAEQNRRKFGRTKLEKSMETKHADKATIRLDGHKLDD